MVHFDCLHAVLRNFKLFEDLGGATLPFFAHRSLGCIKLELQMVSILTDLFELLILFDQLVIGRSLEFVQQLGDLEFMFMELVGEIHIIFVSFCRYFEEFRLFSFIAFKLSV